MRDKQTADLGVQAALTGHLVFSTLHTNNAATCLPRLLDMGVEPFLIASTVRAVIGQRLVRRLCIECRETFVPDDMMRKELTKTLRIEEQAGGIKELNELERQALEDGIGKDAGKVKISTNSLSSTPTAIERLFKAHPDGCASCNHTGYKGRIGIYEVLDNTPEIQTTIVGGATSEKLNRLAVDKGMVTMQLDGLVKALRGQTTIEEILRVTTQE